MATNTLQHISDKSLYKSFDPVGTSFPTNITNVQAALAAIKPVALQGVPNASQTVVGIARFGTQAEVNAGTAINLMVSPATLKAYATRPQATTTVVGITRYATDAETEAGTISDAAVVPSSSKKALDKAINTAFTTVTSTETRLGVIKISTQAQALAGNDDTTAMTPKKVAIAIADATKALPTYSNATQTTVGLVRLATNAEAQGGTVSTNVAITPASLASVTSTTGRRGLIQIASAADAATGTENTKALTALSLLGRTGAINRLGLVKLTTTVNSGDANTALAYNANVIHTGTGTQTIAGTLNINGAMTLGGNLIAGSGTINGNFNVNGNLTKSGSQVVTVDMIKDDVPVGTIVIWGGRSDRIPANWRVCAGGSINGADHPDYVNFVGTMYGGTAASPELPDFRALFVRGAAQPGSGGSTSQVHPAIAAAAQAANPSDKNKAGLGYQVRSYGHNTVQAQQVLKHKHVGGWGENFTNYPYGQTYNNPYPGQRAKLDSDNYGPFTNDGTEVGPVDKRNEKSTLNPSGAIGADNRPWAISMIYIIKVK